VIPVVEVPRLPATFTSSTFAPRLTVRAPTDWTLRTDTRASFALAAPGGGTLRFVIDPTAGTPRVSGTPRGLAQWLQHLDGLTVAAPQTILVGKPALTSTVLDLQARAAAVTYLHAPGGDLRAEPGTRTRLYLAPIRVGSLSHTIAIVYTAGSGSTYASTLSTVAAIVKRIGVRAAAGTNLSALSGFCTDVFYGTCNGELSAGTHTARTFRPKLSVAVPAGWVNFVDHEGVYGLVPPGGEWSVVDSGQSDYIDVFTSIATGNGRCADGQGTIHTPVGIVDWIRHEPGFAPIHPVAASIGGLSGLVVDLRMRKGFKATCPWSRGLPAQQVITGLAPSPDEMNHALPLGHAVMRLYLLHYKGGTLGIEIDDVRDDARMKSYIAVVETMRFTRP
jgi:hypothetical protein